MRAKIEIEAETVKELVEGLARLAAHIMRTDKIKPIKILEDDGRIIASLTIEDEKERPA